MQRCSRGGKTILDRGQKVVDPLPGLGGNKKTRTVRRAARSDIPDVLTLLRIKPIDLVPDFENALPASGVDAKLAQHCFDVLLLRLAVLVRDVPDVENDVGFQYF